MPANAPLGPATLVVETPAGSSKPFSIEVVARSPGIYTLSQQGWGQGSIRLAGKTEHRVTNGPTQPFPPGSAVVMDATGVGDAKATEVVVGGIRARIQNISPSHEGLNQVQFRVPPTAPLGCYVPVYIRAGANSVSNVVSMAIARGDSCELPNAGVLLLKPHMGLLAISHASAIFSDNYPPTVAEQGMGLFRHVPVDPELELSYLSDSPGVSQLMLMPPPGQCTVFFASGAATDFGVDLFDLGHTITAGWRGEPLNAGQSISIKNSRAVRAIPARSGEPGVYAVRLGFLEPGKPPAPDLFLNDSHFEFTGGGKDIGHFSVPMAAPPPIEWTNASKMGIVDRAKSVVFQWRGVPHDALVVILMTSPDTMNAAQGVLYCTARAEAGQLKIPEQLLRSLPKTQDAPAPPTNLAFVAALRFRIADVKIPGLDALWTFALSASGRRVVFR